MSTKKKTSTKSNSTQTTTTPGTGPATDALPGLTAAFNSANAVGPYTGPVNAPIRRSDDILADVYVPDQVFAQQGTQGLEGGMDWIQSTMPQYQQGISDLMGYWGGVASGAYVNPESNPALQPFIDAIKRNANEQQELSMNSLNQAATAAGGYGNSNWGRTKAWAEDRHARALDDTFKELFYKSYLDEMDRRERSGAGLASTWGYGLQPFQDMNAIEHNLAAVDQIRLNNENQLGMTRQMANQALIDEGNMYNQQDYNIAQSEIMNEMARHNALRYDDMNLYAQYFNTLGQIPGGQTTTGESSSQNTQTTSGLGPALSAIGAVGSMFTGGGPFAGMFGGGNNGGNDAGGAYTGFMSPYQIGSAGNGAGMITPYNPLNFTYNPFADGSLTPWIRGGGG